MYAMVVKSGSKVKNVITEQLFKLWNLTAGMKNWLHIF